LPCESVQVPPKALLKSHMATSTATCMTAASASSIDKLIEASLPTLRSHLLCCSPWTCNKKVLPVQFVPVNTSLAQLITLNCRLQARAHAFVSLPLTKSQFPKLVCFNIMRSINICTCGCAANNKCITVLQSNQSHQINSLKQ